MSEPVLIQWFPGHMAKTRRLMKECMSLVDIVVELTDARIPKSSRNPEIESLVAKKPRLVLLNKSDYADDKTTADWINYYKSKNIIAISTDCKNGKGVNKILPAIKDVLKDEIAKWEAKGMVGKPIKIMIVGIPNVGKSSLINKLANSKRAKVEDRPGVTRGKQWISLANGVELLDMPGVLWPKFDDVEVGEHLAFTGAVKDDILDIEHLAVRLIEALKPDYSELIKSRYNISDDILGLEAFDILELIAKKRGMLISGGEVNTERAAIMFVDEFRSSKLGKISLEKPE